MESTYVQRQIQAEHITGGQELIKSDILSSTRELLAQLTAIVINDLHTEGLGFLLQVTANATHAQDSYGLSLGIMPKTHPTTPLPLTQTMHTSIEVPQSTENKEHVHVRGRIVHGSGDIGDANWRVACTAIVDIDLIITGSF